MTTRRGFTLVELLIGLVLMLAVGAVTYQLLVNTQRVTRSQTQQIGMQDNARSGALIIANELREVGYDAISAKAALILPPLAAGNDPDLLAIGPDSITYRAMRATGFTCDLLAGGPDVVVRQDTYKALRTVVTTDSLLLYVEGDASTSADDAWVRAGISVAPVAQLCADGVTQGWRIRLATPFAGNVTAATAFGQMKVGGPVRAFEPMQIRSYVSGGKLWLGMRPRPLDGATQVEPVLGPLANGAGADRGLLLVYHDAADAPTLVPNNVRSIEVFLKSISDGNVRATGRYAAIDSVTLSTRVALRNALRP
jgi:prepilin-type N-terminal cleavage/methylation domain-containing protein